MVNPAALAISLGFGLGAALFLLYTFTSFSRQNSYNESPDDDEPQHRGDHWRDPYRGLRNQFESDICSVCLDGFGEFYVSLECRHRFHRECIERSLRHSPLCPMCRADAKIMH